MYLPKQFEAPEHAWTLIRQHPLGQLISVDAQGLPMLSWLPMHIDVLPEGDAPASLLGHLAKANPHVDLLHHAPQATLVFTGPHAFMPTTVYKDTLRVPTWSYLVVVLRVRAQRLEGEAAKDALLKQLIADHEPAYAQQWRALPEDYTTKMLNAIVAFELRIVDLQCAVKLNQHRPEAHAAMHAAYSAGTAQEQALAAWMTKLGLV